MSIKVIIQRLATGVPGLDEVLGGETNVIAAFEQHPNLARKRRDELPAVVEVA